MDCPVDGTQLMMSERRGIEIDYCPECRGVWLDRGELDKMIERSERENDAPRSSGGESYNRPKKKKSLLSELFELGG